MKITPLIMDTETPIRTILEMDVTAHNKYLRERVKTMNIFELLANCHPLYRLDFARQLYLERQITAKQRKAIDEKFEEPNKYDN